jgi:hypothetical protein
MNFAFWEFKNRKETRAGLFFSVRRGNRNTNDGLLEALNNLSIESVALNSLLIIMKFKDEL